MAKKPRASSSRVRTPSERLASGSDGAPATDHTASPSLPSVKTAPDQDPTAPVAPRKRGRPRKIIEHVAPRPLPPPLRLRRSRPRPRARSRRRTERFATLAPSAAKLLGSGILNQELFIGMIAWNKVRYVKNPDTGKNVTRPNPPEEWVRKEVPELRIIEQEVWDRAKARQRRARNKTNFWDRQRPRYLLSGLLRCGCCGGGMGMISAVSYGCSTARNQGETSCTHRRTVRRDAVERTVLHALQTSLMDPALIGEFCEAYTAHINKLRMEHNASLHRYKAELEKLSRQERRIIDAVKDGYATPTMKAESHEIVNRREELLDLLGRHVEAPTYIHPSMAKRYHQEVAALVDALNDDSRKAEAGDLIRSLVEAVVISPDRDGDGVLIDLHGDLAGILNIATKKEKLNDSNELEQVS